MREDYNRTRNAANKLIKKLKNKKDKQVIGNYLSSLAIDERNDKKCLGLAIWLIRINK